MMGVWTEPIILRRWHLLFDIAQAVAAVRRKAAGTMLEQHKDDSNSQAQPEQ
jgi:hypothetical protein